MTLMDIGIYVFAAFVATPFLFYGFKALKYLAFCMYVVIASTLMWLFGWEEDDEY